LQFGAAILQVGMPVTYFSRKLNSAQHNYAVGKKEIISIVEKLKEFCTMYMVALIFMALQTIRTTCSNACKHNVSYIGVYSWMTIPLHPRQ
jgi:RNase H-like domain found in reverse transcriptase